MASRPSQTRRADGPLAALALMVVVLALLAVIGAAALGRVHVDLSGVARSVVGRILPKPPLPQPIRRVAPPQTPVTHAVPEQAR